MLNKDYFAMKDLAKLNIDGVVYFRIFHHIAGLITGVSVFQLENNPENEEVLLTELPIEDVPSAIQQKIMSNTHTVEVLDDDKSLIIQAFQTKASFIRKIAEKRLNVGLKRKLMEFVEVGGHYFGFVYEDGMPYTKFYHLNVEPVKEELYIDDVPPEMLPALFEAIGARVIKNTESLTIQVGEGVYARVSLVSKNKALVTVVVASKTVSGETQLKVSMGFMLTQVDTDEWLATVVNESDRKKVEKEMEKSFEVVYQELLVKVFEVHGLDTLKGI